MKHSLLSAEVFFMNRSNSVANTHAGARRADLRAKNRGENKENENRLLRLLRGSGIGILSAAVIGSVLLIIASGIVYSQPDPDSLLYGAALLVLAVASLMGGVIAERVSNLPVLPVGMTTGIGWVLLGFLLSLVLGDGVGAFPSVYALALRIPQFLLVLLGAYLAKSRPRKVTSRRRR